MAVVAFPINLSQAIENVYFMMVFTIIHDIIRMAVVDYSITVIAVVDVVIVIVMGIKVDVIVTSTIVARSIEIGAITRAIVVVVVRTLARYFLPMVVDLLLVLITSSGDVYPYGIVLHFIIAVDTGSFSGRRHLHVHPTLGGMVIATVIVVDYFIVIATKLRSDYSEHVNSTGYIGGILFYYHIYNISYIISSHFKLIVVYICKNSIKKE